MGGPSFLRPRLPGAVGFQVRGRKQPPRPANCKLQAIIGSHSERRTRCVVCFTNTSVGVDLKLKTVELRGKKIRL